MSVRLYREMILLKADLLVSFRSGVNMEIVESLFFQNVRVIMRPVVATQSEDSEQSGKSIAENRSEISWINGR